LHHEAELTQSLLYGCLSAAGRGGPIEGNDRAMATVTGIIDGSGSLGAGIGQVGKLNLIINNKLI